MLLSVLMQAAVATGTIAHSCAELCGVQVGHGGWLWIGKIGQSAMEAIARQPDAAGDIRNNMIIVAALIEGVALLAVVVCLLILFI